MDIVFFGSGPVAAKSLELLTTYCKIEAVITKPVPLHHRDVAPVKNLCQKHNLTVFEPASKPDLTKVFESASFSSRVGVVIDYGIIIDQTVLDYFELGIINSHFSLLPQWRGADPITFAILSGQNQTGISIMRITEKMDEGPLLAQAPYDIPPHTTTPELTDALIELSDETLKHILPLYLAGNIDPAPQESATIAPSTEPSYSRKLKKEDGIVDWQKPAEQLEREVRAFTSWPKSRTRLGDVSVSLTAVDIDRHTYGPPGTIHIDGKRLLVNCGNGALEIKQLQPDGKNSMSAEAFLAGYRNRLN